MMQDLTFNFLQLCIFKYFSGWVYNKKLNEVQNSQVFSTNNCYHF